MIKGLFAKPSDFIRSSESTGLEPRVMLVSIDLPKSSIDWVKILKNKTLL
jgi:hypothetical protein